MRRRVILIEFNELTPSLLERFMADDTIPNFKRFFNESIVYKTWADDAQLNPWVVWPTIHSGVPAVEHGIEHMGDGGLELSYSCVGAVASAAGVRVGVFGSMNLNYEELSGYYVPDPWDKRGRAYPKYLNGFYEIISQQVKDSSRYLIRPKQLLQLGIFLVRNGLSLNTACNALRQLVADKIDPGLRWRRALLLDLISYDLFRSLNRRYDIEFATFFSNSTAHFQHFYWSDMEPSAFSAAPSSSHPTLPGAIVSGYRAMDRLLGRIMRDYPAATLVFCTALSQGPAPNANRVNYRTSNFPAFLSFAGLDPLTFHVTPAMSAEFHIYCPTETSASAVADSLHQFTIGDIPALYISVEERKIVLSWRPSEDPGRLDRLMSRKDGVEIRFGDIVHTLEGSASGVHEREGALWIRSREHSVVENYVPLTDIAPTLLDLLHVAQPPHMHGKSLMSKAAGTLMPIS